ncbi:MAG: CFI-box-CTERM domain-containing protein, partial [Chloroflexota bacterium]|nr:CFI-box-CTERM domain-containing protein [Chloroflexota bacterium]
RYYIDWGVLSEGEAGITIERDYDGDGEIDEVIIMGIPIPTSPSPIDNATGVPLDQELSWVVGDSGAVSYDVYFGTDTNPPLVSEEQTETTYAPTLNPDTTYYWRVTATTALNEYSIFATGELWEFTTGETTTPSFCFIATAAYGTPMAKEVQILREFRDGYLLTNPLGQALVDLYYRVSPPIAEFITEHPSLKPIVRTGLVPAVAMSTVAVNTTPAEKTVTVGLLVLVSVALAVWVTRRRGRSQEYTRG